jgi:hypothetical protein
MPAWLSGRLSPPQAANNDAVIKSSQADLRTGVTKEMKPHLELLFIRNLISSRFAA